MARPALRAAVLAACAAAAAAARKISPTEAKVYNYVIVVGVVALVVVYVPLHAVIKGRTGRAVYRGIALGCALAASAASFAGAGLGGKLWQTVPTGVFMLFLAGVVALRVAGGWGVVGMRVRAPGRVACAVLEDGRWRGDCSKEEWSRMVGRAGIGRQLLLLGGEGDQDAVAVGLLRRKVWVADAEDGGGGGGAGEVKGADRHEPIGLALLGLGKYAGLWMPPLCDALRGSEARRRKLAAVHHAGVLVWLAGMAGGALAKTGFWSSHAVAVRAGKQVLGGSDKLRTGGIWIQTVLLLLAVFALPYTRGLVRFGVRIWGRLALLWAQAGVSLGLGVASVIWAREKDINGNSVAYAASLMIAAVAAAAWSVVTVAAHGAGVRRVLAGEGAAAEDGGARRRAYLTGLVTRPRHGYAGKSPVVRWGDLGRDGRAALEVVLERETDVSSDGRGAEKIEDEGIQDEEAQQEWNVLENVANRRTFGL